MSINLSISEFQPAANDKKAGIDIFILRFKAMIETHGFCFPRKNNVPYKIVKKLNTSPGALSNEEWRQTGYPFLKEDRFALIKLSQGEVRFNKKETEALEAICGDFFDLKGEPRNKRRAPAISLVNS